MKVHHIALSVKDAEKSAGFYASTFGFEEVNRFTKPEWDGGAIVLQLGDLQLELFSFHDSTKQTDDSSNLKVRGLKHLGIQVENVHKKYEELKTKGVDIDTPIRGATCAWFCFLRDPDGITIELIEPRSFPRASHPRRRNP
ncbi:MAG: VOC family protein [Nanoarchaeota archaeon]|nr:VOC family protein [Nanoarchaeota archaeon]